MRIDLSSFYFLRHGQTDWNRESRCIGSQDIPLNSLGKKQAEQAQHWLRHTHIMTICYSPLLRAKQTAEILNLHLNCRMVEIDNLRECCWGILEGEHKGDGRQLQAWVSGETPQDAEPYEEYMIRALEGINEALSYPFPLIVAHSGTYWAILKSLGLDHRHRASLPHCAPIYHRPPIDGVGPWLITTLDEVADHEPYMT